MDGGATASFSAPVDGTDLDPIYQTVRYDVSAYDLALPNGSLPRHAPVQRAVL